MSSFASRLVMFFSKTRQRGFGWATRRFAIEIAQPTTLSGRLLRPVVLFGRNLMLLPQRRARHQPTMSDRDGETLYFFYDLETSPITYNVVDDLVAAEMMRRRLALKHLQIIIIPSHEGGVRIEDDAYDSVLDRDARIWRLHNLVIPLFFLLPSCRGYSLLPSREAAQQALANLEAPLYPVGYRPDFPVPTSRRVVFEAARRHEDVFPALVAPQFAVGAIRRWLEINAGKRRTIVITLRRYSYMVQRNSRASDWMTFIEGIDRSLYCPIVVPDTETAMDPLPELPAHVLVFAPAAWNQALRLALYEQAWLNMATVHGPTELCWYSERCRYLLFMETDTAPQTAGSLLEADGFEIGAQLPWASPLQRWVWKADLSATIRSEFDHMVETIEAFGRQKS